LFPSKFSPFKAKNIEPLLINRVSVETELDSLKYYKVLTKASVKYNKIQKKRYE